MQSGYKKSSICITFRSLSLRLGQVLADSDADLDLLEISGVSLGKTLEKLHCVWSKQKTLMTAMGLQSVAFTSILPEPEKRHREDTENPACLVLKWDIWLS